MVVKRVERIGQAFVAENAAVTGDVTLGPGASVWFGCVLRGDDAPIRVGARTNIQDLTMVHADPGVPYEIGADITVGHRAILHGKVIEDRCLIGMGAILLSGSVIGAESIIGAGAVVTENKVIPPPFPGPRHAREDHPEGHRRRCREADPRRRRGVCSEGRDARGRTIPVKSGVWCDCSA